jgi:hypothetical protein
MFRGGVALMHQWLADKPKQIRVREAGGAQKGIDPRVAGRSGWLDSSGAT